MKFAVIGSNVKKSLSPDLNSLIYKQIKENHSYDYINVNEYRIDDVIRKLKENIYDGINITSPYKTSIIKYLDSVDENAANIGSVNCVYSKDGYLKGYNTDFYGFKKLIEINDLKLKTMNILVLGAGGVSRAVCSYLKYKKISFSIYNRSSNKVKNIIDDLSLNNICRYRKIIDETIKYDTIVNCLSNSKECYEIINSCIKANNISTIIDLNYGSVDSDIFNLKSINYINGLYMLIFQAIKSNQIWLGNRLPLHIDYITLYKTLKDEIC